jgi:predicted O-methyltransferase YrrM
MPVIRTALNVAAAILKNPRRLARVLDSPRPISGKEQLQRYFDRPPGLRQINLLDILPNFRESISPYSYLEGQPLPTDIALLKGLAKKRSGCRYLEIGSWRGESLANMASVCAECVAITLPPDDMRAAGYSEAAIACEGFFIRHFQNVRLIKHNSRTFDFGQFGRYFDVVFIDGDHSPEAIMDDTRNAFSVLRNQNSVIVWHDYGLTPESINYPTLKGIRKGCPPEKLQFVFHVSNTLCAAFINDEPSLRSEIMPYPQTPDKVFEVTLSAKKLYS